MDPFQDNYTTSVTSGLAGRRLSSSQTSPSWSDSSSARSNLPNEDHDFESDRFPYSFGAEAFNVGTELTYYP